MKNYKLTITYYNNDWEHGVMSIMETEKYGAYDNPHEAIADAREWIMTDDAKEADINDFEAKVYTDDIDGEIVYDYWKDSSADDSRDATMQKVQDRLEELGLTCLYYGPEEDDPDQEYEFYGVYDDENEGVSEIIWDDAEKAKRLGIFTWDDFVYPY